MEKIKHYVPITAVVFMIIVFMNTCGTKSKVKSLKKDIVKLENVVKLQDSLISNTVSKNDLRLIIELEGLKISKRNLYDQNSIIRTKIRPDDKMNEYDQKMNDIRKKLK